MMRVVTLPLIGETSALGFGCASLGSRISARDGQAAIERALAAGVIWFDVAPSYGDGQAERLLGRSLGSSSAFVATKVGLVAPQRNGLVRLARNLAQPAIGALPFLRPLARRLRGPVAQHVRLDGDTIRTSLARSLERLDRDRVDLFSVHDPSIEDMQDSSVIRALDDLRSQGLARQIGIAGSPEAWRAARSAGLEAIAQVGNNPFQRNVKALGAPDAIAITHTALGFDGALQRLTRAMKDSALGPQFKALGYDQAADLLIDYAFAANPMGVVLLSSFGAHHLHNNILAANRAPKLDLPAKVDAIVDSLKI